MADDNAWILRNYIDAYSLFGDMYFKEIAEGIIRFLRDVLSDPEGGFFASQDADVTPDDEGGYFTWTDEDLKRILTIEEYEVLSLRFFHERGTLPQDQEKKVLCAAREIREIAGTLGISDEAVTMIIARGREKLLAE